MRGTMNRFEKVTLELFKAGRKSEKVEILLFRACMKRFK
jgi:hypothetical protein